MLFNTFHFAYFFAILLPIYWILPHSLDSEGLRRRLSPWVLRPLYWVVRQPQNILLLAASYYFYACWDWRFLSLLILSTAMDFGCGLAVDRIDEPRKRKLFVALSMALNLGMLGYFKYYNFFAESLQAMLARAGLSVPLAHLNVVLPIGISFYTFQSMSYVIDIYRRDIKPTRNFVEFAAFVSFFPHLVAGPIMRPTSLLPQIEAPRRFNLQQFYQGAYLIFWGLTKKVVVADNLALIVNDLFGKWETIDGGLAMVAIYAFTFQIYCDFSGYTDAARGIAKCLGFELALNFNLPYFATSPQEFWSRWHISLSSWLRDYLYIPLGGNRKANGVIVTRVLMAALIGGLAYFLPAAFGLTTTGTKLMLIRAGIVALLAPTLLIPVRRTMAVYRNLMLTMVIGGLWHGAAWTFVLWGFYHGVLLVGHRIAKPWLDRIRPADPVEAACWKGVRIVATFHMVCVGWLIFRATSIRQVVGMVRAVVERPAIPASAYMLPVAVLIVPLLLYQIAQYVTDDLDVIARTPWYVRSVFYTACFYAFVLGGEFGGSQFIYFQF